MVFNFITTTRSYAYKMMVNFVERTFYGLPKVNVDDVVKGTIAILGSRITTKSIHPPHGVEKATYVLRKVSDEYSGYIPYLGITLHDKDVVDLGDFDKDTIGETVKTVIELGGIAFVIGGDHATTFYALEKVEGLNNIVWLDAHLDLANQGDFGIEEEISHASALYNILEKKNIEATIIGFRGHSTPVVERERVNKLRIKTVSDLRDERLVVSLLKNADAVSLDIDFFDAAEFIATRVPEIGGISVREFLKIITKIDHLNARYFDITEYCPDIDPGHVYAKILVQLIPYIIGLFIRSGYG